MATRLPDHSGPPFEERPDSFRAESLRRTLARRPPGDGTWIFAYGSLMWDPCFASVEWRPATVDGYRRAFTMWSRRARGTPQRPGLGLGLEDGGGSSVGIAYRLDPTAEEEALKAAWKREMVTGIYEAQWVRAATAGGTVPAIAFVIDRDHPQYAGPMPVEDMADIIAAAAGSRGPCRDYLANVVEELRKLEAPDPDLVDLLARVDAKRPGVGA